MKHITSRKNKKLPVEVTEEPKYAFDKNDYLVEVAESTIKQRRRFALLPHKDITVREQKEIFGK